jgi:hypothetical protein
MKKRIWILFSLTWIFMANSHATPERPKFWNGIFRGSEFGWRSGWNFQCRPVDCVDSSPKLNTVNCTNLTDLMFAGGSFDHGAAPGYVWFAYNPDGPTLDDWALKRDFTIDGKFFETGFKGEGPFRSTRMGSSGRVAMRSMSIEMLPPEGASARVSIDFGGETPLRASLTCCTPGMECDELRRQEFEKENQRSGKMKQLW